MGRLRRLLDTPDTAWLLARMRTRLENSGELKGWLVRPAATSAERVAASRLAGHAVRAGQSASVSLDELDEMLRRTGVWPQGLVSAVVALTGAVVSRQDRSAERDAWLRVTDTLRQISAQRPPLLAWVDGVIRTGALKRVAGSAPAALRLAEQLVTVANALPSPGESVAAFATRLFANPNALDPQAPLGTIAARLAAAQGALHTDAVQDSARWRREAWQSVGLVVDELSSTVLVIGLPGDDSGPTARALAALHPVGQPTILTLRQLNTDGVGMTPPHVFVCENAAVVAAAADRLGATCPPVVCTAGQPGAAVIALLEMLSAGGAVLHYHGDFDWDGLATARAFTRRVAWVPWRFDSDAYGDALALSAQTPSAQSAPLAGVPGESPWDRTLATAMGVSGLKVEEEVVLDLLLGDLAAAAK
ncbi:uncharacterized protein (TIGR02679 family) [Glaciihabitans tibetensis]|uniref:Uncharacterized protein (TIGR02679 family) n=2 Tax=Glaciihabitans tibetensis TaxID=1266600 RepID=A0A2T0VK57_9MICO|nr:uncharacterized protein (TIGR02679 family) [Glaciihabitans tibetensis]